MKNNNSKHVELFPTIKHPQDLANSRSSNDTSAVAMVLGTTYNNPYLIPNMRQAYLNIFGSLPPCDLPVTDLYIKWTPNSWEDVNFLTKNNTIEITTYPLDRKILVEGDYYTPDDKTPSDLPVFYSIVKANAVLPTISHEVLAEMFIPKKSLNLEQEAFRLANVTDELSNNFISNRESIIQDIRLDPCSEYPIELVRLGCIPCDDVPIGSERGSGNVSGYVKVENKPACPAQWRPVRRVKVVIRGGFLNLKRDVVYTDDDGFFRSDKNFKNCTFKVCYRNDYGKVVDFQNGWQYFWNFMDEYTVHYPSWILSGGGTVDLFIPHSGIGSSQQNGDWCGAVIHNGLIEHNEMSTSQSIPTAPYLTVVLHKVKGGHHAGTVMGNYTIGLADFTTGKKFFESLGIFLSNTLTFGLQKIYTADVRFGYGRPPHDEPTFYNTDRYCEVVYHEFSHAQTPQRTGYFWYLTFGLAELNNPGPDPYGSCCQYNSDIISVGESYAYHMGHWMASTKWGECCTTFPEQGDIDNLIGVRYFSNAMGPTGNSHINFLEHFDPNWSADGAKWIPKGIMWDLIDGVGDPNGSNVRDNVPSGFFTNKKLFDGLGSDVKSMPQYKQKLLNMYSGTALNLIQAPIDTLFKDYKY